jgi:hypothetical protein
MKRRSPRARCWRAGGGHWTPSYVQFVLPLTAEQVLVSQNDTRGGVSPESRAEWVWIATAQRLAWHYGVVEAARRLNGCGG